MSFLKMLVEGEETLYAAGRERNTNYGEGGILFMRTEPLFGRGVDCLYAKDTFGTRGGGLADYLQREKRALYTILGWGNP